MDELADRLDQAADLLSTLDKRIPEWAIEAQCFGADEAGAPGRLGRDLHAHWAAVLGARSQEAATAAAQLGAVARSVRITRQAYVDTDRAVQDRMRREL